MGAVAQLSCTDNECVSDCSNSQWNINQCYNTTGGNSQIFLSCDDGGVKGIDYTGPDCTGQGTSGSMDVAKCLVSETNTSFINTCVTSNVGENNFEALSFAVRKQKVLQMFQPLASAVAQLSCTDDECVSDCSNSQWNINQCYNTTGGNSQIFLSCDDGGVTRLDYTGPGCTGQGASGRMDVAKCLISEIHTSFINTCVSSVVIDETQNFFSSSIPRAREFVV